MGRTRLVKLSDEEYELLQKAKRELARSGTKSLPKDVREKIEQRHPLADFALGAIVGVGAIVLLAALLDDSED